MHELEENNLQGTIPHEISELKELEFWGMERGKLTGQIPTSIASLTNLFFIDLDYNELTGKINYIERFYMLVMVLINLD